MSYARPEPPSQTGIWTLLQSRLDRSFWQCDREFNGRQFSHFVIMRNTDRYDYDTFDEAEALFFALDEEEAVLKKSAPLALEPH